MFSEIRECVTESLISMLRLLHGVEDLAISVMYACTVAGEKYLNIYRDFL